MSPCGVAVGFAAGVAAGLAATVLTAAASNRGYTLSWLRR